MAVYTGHGFKCPVEFSVCCSGFVKFAQILVSALQQFASQILFPYLLQCKVEAHQLIIVVA